MSDDQKDHLSNPIVDYEGQTPFGSPVIDLAEMRIAFGRAKDFKKVCSHRRLTYDPKERRVWCQECESTIDNFDAFMTLASHWHEMERAARAKLARAAETEKATLVKRAAKNLDRHWNCRHPMAVSCPHCQGGLLPEDFQSGGTAVSRDIELARRARVQAGKEPK